MSDPDDGIHIVSVSSHEGPNGLTLRAVVVWRERGEWTGDTFELPAPGRAAVTAPTRSAEGAPPLSADGPDEAEGT